MTWPTATVIYSRLHLPGSCCTLCNKFVFVSRFILPRCASSLYLSLHYPLIYLSPLQAERSAHQNKMRSAKTYDECKVIQTEHHAVIAARAKGKGITLNVPSQNACDRMQMRGVLK